MTEYKDKDDEDDEKEFRPSPSALMFKIIDLKVFTTSMYLTSYMNFDVMMLPQIHQEKDFKRREILKTNFISEMYNRGVDPKDIEEMKSIYPIEKAEELIKSFILVGDSEDEIYVLASEVVKIQELISREMIYAVFDRLAKEGKVELCWDDKKQNFVYGIKPENALR